MCFATPNNPSFENVKINAWYNNQSNIISKNDWYCDIKKQASDFNRCEFRK
jgi:hypothetical protein